MSRFIAAVITFFVVVSPCQGFKLRRPVSVPVKLLSTTQGSIALNEEIPAEGTMMKSPAFKIFDFIMSIPIVHGMCFRKFPLFALYVNSRPLISSDIMFGIYRKQIVEKSEKMGLPWTEFMDEQWESLPDLEAKAKAMTNPAVTIPDYYYAPIHAYKDGNLCWESAMEEDLWSKLMIAPLYNNALDGDVQMRQKWLAITAAAIKPNPVKATDLGCGTGLSMYMLDSKWPSIDQVTGVDLSTYKLAVCEEKKKMMVRKCDK